MPKTIYSPEQQKLSALLRQLRAEAGLSQVALAQKLRQRQSFVSKYESGERLLDVVELRQISSALGLTLQEFVRRWEETLES